MEQIGSHWTHFWKILYLRILENLSRKFKLHYNLTRTAGTSHEDLLVFMMASRWIILRIRSTSDKTCTENQNTPFYVQHLFLESCLLWQIVEKYGTAAHARDDSIIWRMRFACWITKATDTHSECVIPIAFPRQQWLRERASILHLHVQYCLCCSMLK
jgi:hypothetical protein